MTERRLKLIQEVKVQLPFRVYVMLISASTLLNRRYGDIVTEALKDWLEKNIKEDMQKHLEGDT